MTDKTLNLSVFARAKSDGFGVVASQTEKLKGSVGKLAAVVGGLFAANKLAGFFSDSVAEARESQKVNAQTAAVIKSTGGAANLTAKQFGDLATSISNKVGIDDEQIQSSENMLATFTNVRNELGKGNDVFSQATQTITDMSVALGTDSKNSAIMLGKALNDPIKGVGALSRVGVTFTEQQKKQIKTLTDSGNVLGAQKVILKELSKEFGGSAAAQATSADKAKVAWGNLKESLGGIIIPLLDKAASVLTTYVVPALSSTVSWVQAHWPQMQAVIVTAWTRYIRPALMATVSFFMTKVIPAVKAVVGWLVEHWPQIRKVLLATWAAIKPVLQSFGNLVMTIWNSVLKPIVGWIRDHWSQISTVVKIVFVAVAVAAKILLVAIKLAFDSIALTIRTTVAVIRGLWTAVNAVWAAIRTATTSTKNWIVARWNDVISFFRAIPGRIASVAAMMWNGPKNTAVAVKNWVVARWNDVVSFVRTLGGRIASVAAAMWNGPRNAVVTLKNWIVARWNDVIGFVRGLPGRVTSVASGMWNGIKGALGTIGTWISAKFTGIVGWVKAMPGRISAVASGMWNGIKEAFRAAIDWIIDGWNGLQFKIPGFKVGPVHFGGFTLGVPDIPRLARGGITSGPTLAVVGDNPGGREAIIPLPRGGGGLGTTVIQFDFTGADSALVELFRKAIRVRGGNVQVVLGGRTA